MQTFLPYADFKEVAHTLDNKRLGKQRVEGLQIINIITTSNYVGGWMNHPAIHMWRGYEHALMLYVNSMIDEWQRRGFQNTMQHYTIPNTAASPIIMPWWLGDARLHDSHKSNLLRKDPVYYSQFGWNIRPDLPYYWPVPSVVKEKRRKEDIVNVDNKKKHSTHNKS